MRDIGELIKSMGGDAGASHSYIIEGRAGRARDAFANEVVRGLDCRNPEPDGRPCGCCDSCIQTKAGTNPDVVRMIKSGKTSYTVRDATAFMDRLSMSPYERFLIGVVDDAETLNEEAQNKLLKTLEEPADDVIILLLAAGSDELLPTVKSRCGIIRSSEYEGYEDADSGEADELAEEGARMLLCGDAAFYEFRDYLDKSVKTAGEALKLLAEAEQILRAKMIKGEDAEASADMIELAEKASLDIHGGMDPAKALKKLYLDINT